MIVLDHTHGCALSRPEQLEDLRKSARVYKEAIVAMRTLYQFVRLMPGYRHYRTRLGTPARPGPRSGVLAEQPASSLEFNIERVSVHSVTATPRKKLHAMSVLTPFGRLSVDMEYSPMCEDISSPARLPSTTTTAPPPLSDSSLRRSHPSLLPEVPAASAPAAESADGFPSSSLPGFDSLTPGVAAGPRDRGDHVGRYTLTKMLGRGMYGVVYRAEVRESGAGAEPGGGTAAEPPTGRAAAACTVAIKAIDRESWVHQASGALDAKKKSYVEEEIRVMAAVDHPNVVRLIEPLYSETHVYLVMEHCQLDLAKYCRQRPPLAESTARSFMRDLSQGLQTLRSIDIVHRDLKPENLLLSPVAQPRSAGEAHPPSSDGEESGREYTLKITDFGMARTLADGAASLAATQCGSPAFMAPEVLLLRRRPEGAGGLAGGGYDEKADLWSVGCVLYYMLTKRHVTEARYALACTGSLPPVL